MKIQTSNENGCKKEKRSGGSLMGFVNNILMPKVMKGIVKSTTFLRSYVIVKSHMARSAFYKIIFLLNYKTVR